MLLLIILLFFIWFSFAVQSRKSEIFFAVSLCIYVSVIIGFRGEYVGTDTSRYYEIFRALNSYESGENREALFVAFNRFIGFFTENPSVFTFVVALITLVNITIFIIKYSPSVTLSWFTFVGIFSFFGLTNIIRQDLAISVVLIGIPFIFARQFFLFLALTLFASLIHVSAIFSFILYYIYKFKINPVILFVTWLISIPFIFNPQLGLSVFLGLDFVIPSQYSKYLFSEDVLGKVYTYNSGAGKMIAQSIVFIQLVALYFLKNKDTVNNLDEDKKNRYVFFLTVSIIYFISNNIFGLIPFIGRVFAVFFMISIVALPVALKSLRFDRQLQYITNVLFALYCSLIFLSVIVGGTSNGAFPYIVSLPF